MITLAEKVAVSVERGKREIRNDIAEGRVPAPKTFSDLHDHVDANEYGGLCEEGHGLGNEEWQQWGVEVQNALDAWIQEGMPTRRKIVVVIEHEAAVGESPPQTEDMALVFEGLRGFSNACVWDEYFFFADVAEYGLKETIIIGRGNPPV